METTKKQRLKILKNFSFLALFLTGFYYLHQPGIAFIQVASIENLVLSNRAITKILLIETGFLYFIISTWSLWELTGVFSQCYDKVIEEWV